MKTTRCFRTGFAAALPALTPALASANSAAFVDFVAVPTLDDLGLVLLAAVLAGAGAVALRMRKRE